MITATADEPFELLLLAAPAGIVGSLTLEIYDPSDGWVLSAASTAGIAEPAPGTYRAERTVAAFGSFMARWVRTGATPVLLGEEEVVVSENTVLDGSLAWRPIPQQVADLTLNRTRDDASGALVGEFTTDTEPSLELVDRLIDAAAGELQDAIGVPVPSDYWDEARRVAAMRVASLIGLTLDDAGTDPSAQRRYEAMYLDGRDRLMRHPWDHAGGGSGRGTITSLLLTSGQS